MLASRVSNLSVGGSRCYDRMNAQVKRADEGYAGAEEVFGIRRGEDVMAEGRIPAGGVHGSGVLFERGVRLGNAEVVGRPVDFGDGGVWEALPDYFWVERCRRHDVGGGGETFILVDGAPPFAVDQ